MSNEHCRITEDVPPLEMIKILTGGNIGSVQVLVEWLDRDPLAFLGFLTSLDIKHLYDEHIWCVYNDVCGADIDRFIYHVSMELPDQITGKLRTSGPYQIADMDAFFAERCFGEPGSYWALKNPPSDPYYVYPIVHPPC